MVCQQPAMAEGNGQLTTTEEHLHLSSIIIGLHRRLRREYRASGHATDVVWQAHLQNQAALLKYADAMYQLATRHWSGYPETRIDWCRRVTLEFFHQGGLKVALEKDAKRMYHQQLRSEKILPSSADCGDTADSEEAWSHPRRANVRDRQELEAETQVTLPLSGKIRLLDVGSCYNPFQAFPEFDVLGIDLTPANQSVIQCDFLQLELRSLPVNTTDPLTFDLSRVTNPLLWLPVCSLHVVVFSLLLEYLPCPAQRWRCCVQAHGLLAVHGLLLVITPDSHSQHRNSAIIKSWKEAIESLGFLRWKYEKKEHVHCMAFRKISRQTKTIAGSVDDVEGMLYIPQDFNDACYNGADVERTDCATFEEADEEFTKLTMQELPSLDIVDS